MHMYVALHSAFLRVSGEPREQRHAFGGHLPICLGVASIRYAFSTVSHGDHTFTCQSACRARYATRVGGRRLFPHNCSNAVEKASVGTEDVAAGERRAGGGIVCV